MLNGYAEAWRLLAAALLIQDMPGKVLGPDFWETTRAVAPVVGALVTLATFYLRSVIRTENQRQKDSMMREIRELFATQKELASLKEITTVQFTALTDRLRLLESDKK